MVPLLGFVAMDFKEGAQPADDITNKAARDALIAALIILLVVNSSLDTFIMQLGVAWLYPESLECLGLRPL